MREAEEEDARKAEKEGGRTDAEQDGRWMEEGYDEEEG